MTHPDDCKCAECKEWFEHKSLPIKGAGRCPRCTHPLDDARRCCPCPVRVAA